MYVGDYMSTNVLTCTPETLVIDAQRMLAEHRIRRLVVLDGGRLVGIVTRAKLRDVTPSPATSLSTWELNYLLAKMKVGEVMERTVVTCTPDMTIEDAAQMARIHGVGALPVIEREHLVGIITQTDLFNIFTQVLGVGKSGVRLHIQESFIGRPLGAITHIINRHKVEIYSMFSVTVPRTGRRDLMVRLKIENYTELVADFRARGYQVEVSK